MSSRVIRNRGKLPRTALGLVALLLLTQACTSRPKWVETVPKSSRNEYFAGVGTASTTDAALSNAEQDALAQVCQSRRVALSERTLIRTEAAESDKGLALNTSMQRSVTLICDTVSVRALRHEVFGPRSSGMLRQYEAAILLRIPKGPDSYVRPPSRLPQIVASAVVPGLGQAIAGNSSKAARFMIPAAIGTGTAVYYSGVHNREQLAASNALSQADRTAALQQRDAAREIVYGAWAVTGLTYALSVFDILNTPVRFYPIRDGIGVRVLTPSGRIR